MKFTLHILTIPPIEQRAASRRKKIIYFSAVVVAYVQQLSRAHSTHKKIYTERMGYKARHPTANFLIIFCTIKLVCLLFIFFFRPTEDKKTSEEGKTHTLRRVKWFFFFEPQSSRFYPFPSYLSLTPRLASTVRLLFISTQFVDYFFRLCFLLFCRRPTASKGIFNLSFLSFASFLSSPFPFSRNEKMIKQGPWDEF